MTATAGTVRPGHHGYVDVYSQPSPATTSEARTCQQSHDSRVRGHHGGAAECGSSLHFKPFDTTVDPHKVVDANALAVDDLDVAGIGNRLSLSIFSVPRLANSGDRAHGHSIRPAWRSPKPRGFPFCFRLHLPPFEMLSTPLSRHGYSLPAPSQALGSRRGEAQAATVVCADST